MCSQKFCKIYKKTPVSQPRNKVAGLRPVTLLKKRLWHRCFPVNFAKFLRTPFLQNTSGRLLLSFIQIVYSIRTLDLTETWSTHKKQNHDNIRILIVQVHHVDNILYESAIKMVSHLWWIYFLKIINGFTILIKKFYHRYLTGSLIHHWSGLISFLKNFAIFTGKLLCWGLFLIKLQASWPVTILKKDSSSGVFLWIFRNF